ncbi:competence protein CoiA [Lactobacillaceae bacterium Scapto_B20]
MLVAYDLNHQMIMAKDANKVQKLFCCACRERVILRTGNLRMAHFAHQKGSNCKSFSEGETSEHLLGKQQLYNFFMDSDRPRLEHYFKVIKQRPDLLLNHRKIIEFQCSPISDQRLSERLAGYKRINHKSTWILGSPYLKQRFSYKKHRQFLMYYHRIGFYIMYWDVHDGSLLIRYRIRMVFDKIVYDEIKLQNLIDLRHFLRNPPMQGRLAMDSYNHLVNQLKKMTLNFQKRVIKGQLSFQLINFCYQNGFNIAGYPLEIDIPLINIPILGRYLIGYKITMLLILKQYVKMDSHQLIRQVEQTLGIDISFQMIDSNTILSAMQTIFNGWQHQGLIKINNNQIELVNFPDWYPSSDAKLKSINKIKKNRLINQFFK